MKLESHIHISLLLHQVSTSTFSKQNYLQVKLFTISTYIVCLLCVCVCEGKDDNRISHAKWKGNRKRKGAVKVWCWAQLLYIHRQQEREYETSYFPTLQSTEYKVSASYPVVLIFHSSIFKSHQFIHINIQSLQHSPLSIFLPTTGWIIGRKNFMPA